MVDPMVSPDPTQTTPSAGVSSTIPAATGSAPPFASGLAVGGGISASAAETLLALLTNVSNSVNETLSQLKSVTEDVQKVSSAVAEQANFQTTSQGAEDPYENKRRDRAQYDALQSDARVQNNALFGLMATNFDLIMKQYSRVVDVAASGMWRVPTAGDTPTAGAASASKA